MSELILKETYYPAVFVTHFINFVIGFIEAILVFRLVLELFGASPVSPFIAWIYTISAGLLGPFTGAFPALNLGGASILDVVALLAMIIYAVIGWLILEVLSFIFVSRLP